MKSKVKASGASSAARAEFVRAFYDAADRFVEAQRSGSGSSDQEAVALRSLEYVIDGAKGMDSAEFTDALQAASEDYFARVSRLPSKVD